MHPGYAKNKMVNAGRVLSAFVMALPQHRTPETTEGREGFLHPTSLATGTIFTIPALFLWGATPPYLQVVALAFLGAVAWASWSALRRQEVDRAALGAVALCVLANAFLREPLLLAFTTASSEAAYPKTLERLERFGCSPKVANSTIPRVTVRDFWRRVISGPISRGLST